MLTIARADASAIPFVMAGVARGSAFFYGVHRDVMAVPRPEWQRRGL